MSKSYAQPYTTNVSVPAQSVVGNFSDGKARLAAKSRSEFVDWMALTSAALNVTGPGLIGRADAGAGAAKLMTAAEARGQLSLGTIATESAGSYLPLTGGTVAGDLGVTGTGLFLNSISSQGTLSAVGSSLLIGHVTNMTTSNTLGAATFGDTVGVTGALTADGGLTTTGKLYADNALDGNRVGKLVVDYLGSNNPLIKAVGTTVEFGSILQSVNGVFRTSASLNSPMHLQHYRTGQSIKLQVCPTTNYVAETAVKVNHDLSTDFYGDTTTTGTTNLNAMATTEDAVTFDGTGDYSHHFDFNTPGLGGRFNIKRYGSTYATLSGRSGQEGLSWANTNVPFVGIGSQDGKNRSGHYAVYGKGINVVGRTAYVWNEPWVYFGGTTGSDPALKKTGTGIEARLGDDSAGTNIEAASFSFADTDVTETTGGTINVKKKGDANQWSSKVHARYFGDEGGQTHLDAYNGSMTLRAGSSANHILRFSGTTNYFGPGQWHNNIDSGRDAYRWRTGYFGTSVDAPLFSNGNTGQTAIGNSTGGALSNGPLEITKASTGTSLRLAYNAPGSDANSTMFMGYGSFSTAFINSGSARHLQLAGNQGNGAKLKLDKDGAATLTGTLDVTGNQTANRFTPTSRPQVSATSGTLLQDLLTALDLTGIIEKVA